MKARIYITLRAGVLDPQGKAVVASLKTLGFDEVQGARIGKFIELELDGASREAAIERIGKMCEKLLANTVIENYRIEVD
ncbi:MAG: phosphoribosylformylglycinamidine synthase subunit PurS [Deltaproteobacteria bacterium]|nr:phosphoribosylformylglycinamidine synthase subunit PurS [Deltaproteobacteria bacterium]